MITLRENQVFFVGLWKIKIVNFSSILWTVTSWPPSLVRYKIEKDTTKKKNKKATASERRPRRQRENSLEFVVVVTSSVPI